MSAAVVGLVALGTALATGLGALPFIGRGRAVESWLGSADAVAAGVMLAATAALAIEAVELGAGRALAGGRSPWPPPRPSCRCSTSSCCCSSRNGIGVSSHPSFCGSC